MNMQDLINVISVAEQDKQKYEAKSTHVEEDHSFYGNQYSWLLGMVKKYVRDNSRELTAGSIEKTINLKLTYHELSNLLDLIEVGLIQKGLGSVEDDTKKLYYSLINTWGEHAECENDN